MMTTPMTSAERRAHNRRLFRWERYEAALARAGNPRPWIYVIGCDEVRLVKVGVSTSPLSRMATMQTGCPVVLRLLWTMPGSIDVEQDLHECLKAYRKHGEWFDFGDDHPVAMVAAAAALLGHWAPRGLSDVPLRVVSPPDSSSAPRAAADEEEEIPPIVFPEWFVRGERRKPVDPPPLPPGPRRTEEIP